MYMLHPRLLYNICSLTVLIMNLELLEIIMCEY